MLIAYHGFMDYRFDIRPEIKILCRHLSVEHRYQSLYYLRNAEFLLYQADLSAFDLGHIQHAVYKSEQMLAGYRYLVERVHNSFLVVYIHRGNGGHSEDRVHRRAYIVRHI